MAASPAQLAWREVNADRYVAYSRKHNLAKYGLTPESYDALLATQGGVCAICGRPERVNDRLGRLRRFLAVDHDPQTGEVRGLLCHHCNTALGHADDEPALLRQMATYLEARR